MSLTEQILNVLSNAVGQNEKRTTSAYDTPATVKRVEDDTAWVHIPGGVDETPVKMTINAKPGDTVQIRIGGGSAWMVGNQTAPPTDDTKAKEAEKKAEEASGTATKFVTDTSDGIFVHPKNNDADGVRITDAIEIIKGKASMFKAYVENSVAKVRVGRADKGHVEIDETGMTVYGGSSVIVELAKLGYTNVAAAGQNPFFAPFFTLGSRTAGTAIGEFSVAEGTEVEASGRYAHAEGIGSKATGSTTHAEGSGTEATGSYSHAEGRKSKATGMYAHAEGDNTTASGEAAHASGDGSVASGDCSFAHGLGTVASGDNATALGTYNTQNSGVLFALGNGTSNTQRSDAFWVGYGGNVGFSGVLYSGQPETNNRYKMFVIDSMTEDNISIAANGSSGTVTVNLAKTGYKPFALRGLRLNNATTNGSNAASCAAYSFRVEGNSCICAIHNHSASAAKIKVVCDVLYIADAAM